MEGEDVSKIAKEEDPFWEPTEDVLVGTANVFLQSLAYALDFNDKLSITDYKVLIQFLFFDFSLFVSRSNKRWNFSVRKHRKQIEVKCCCCCGWDFRQGGTPHAQTLPYTPHTQMG